MDKITGFAFKDNGAEGENWMAARLRMILAMPARGERAAALKDAGFRLKYRDLLSSVLWGLVQKGLNGDVSAVKEMQNLLDGEDGASRGERNALERVVIVDDAKD